MFHRFALLIITNIAVVALIMFLVSFLGLEPYLTANGLNYESLAILSLVYGFVGSFVSLIFSKQIAKLFHRVKIIQTPHNSKEIQLLELVQKLSHSAKIGMPEVGIYPSKEINAFATGANRNNALVAVSEGLLDQFTLDEMEGVLAHEIAHIRNGDMITMTLLQGIVNAFIIFLSRAAAQLIGSAIARERNSSLNGLLYVGLSIGLEIVFGILAMPIVFAFSRHREFRADAGGASFAGKMKMIAALQRLKKMEPLAIVGRESRSMATMKISDRRSRFGQLFSTHPNLDARIEALQKFH
jgi:heat shock protein HtpX